MIPKRLFMLCEMLVDVNASSLVIDIEDEAFWQFKRLASLELHTGLKSIGREAFRETALKHFHFPATVETIGSDVLDGCTELVSMILPFNLETNPDRAFSSCSKL